MKSAILVSICLICLSQNILFADDKPAACAQSSSGAVTNQQQSGVASEAPVISEWKTYSDADWKFSLEVPGTWTIETILENSGKPHYVIKKKIALTGPQGPQVMLDIWTNDTGVDLISWEKAYHSGLLSDRAEVPKAPNIQVAGQPALQIFNPQYQACNQQLTIWESNGVIFRIEYRVTDNGKSKPIIEHMLNSFKMVK